jgi:cardiolipin synthase
LRNSVEKEKHDAGSNKHEQTALLTHLTCRLKRLPAIYAGIVRFRLVLAGLALLSAACAELPEVRYVDSSLSAPPTPTVESARGLLGKQASRALLARHWHNSHTSLSQLAAVEEEATKEPLIAGNKVTLLYDGPQTMKAMMAAISGAKDSIDLETYIFDQDPLGLRFADLLIARQRAGVQVNIIYDSVGTLGTPQSFFDKMRDAGIHLLPFNPVNPLKLMVPWELNNRDHRKILVVDGKIGFTGGVNISQYYARSSPFRSKSKNNEQYGWRDTHLQIEGPAVAALQWVFVNNWMSNSSQDLPDSNFFPPLKNVGDKVVQVLASEPDSDPDVYRAYVLAIQQAKKTIHITNAYFVPDAQILQALCNAAQRGIDVKIIVPGVTDVGIVFNATRSFYSQMLECGIKVYQLQIAVLHAKTAVIDDDWSTVGSTNFDTRSFLHNKEINVIVFGSEFGNAMERAFADDLRDTVEIDKEKWEERSLYERIKEWMARSLAYWL